MRLVVRPCTVKFARRWVADVHRHLPKIQGALWALRALRGDEIIGVAVVGNPARQWQDESVLCLLRMAVLERQKNACSFLYGACSRAARAMGASDLVTYTLPIEPGTSLRAAGWIFAGMTNGGEWDCVSRPRQKSLFPDPKKRWFAPWGERARRILNENERAGGVNDSTPRGDLQEVRV